MSDGEDGDGRGFPAHVVEVLSPTQIVINRGREDGIEEGTRFLVYVLSDDELTDPETGDSLGHLEIVKGTGVATHAQERMTTVRSDMKSSPERKVVRKQGPGQLFSTEVETVQKEGGEIRPFKDPERGDRVKPV